MWPPVRSAMARAQDQPTRDALVSAGLAASAISRGRIGRSDEAMAGLVGTSDGDVDAHISAA